MARSNQWKALAQEQHTILSDFLEWAQIWEGNAAVERRLLEDLSQGLQSNLEVKIGNAARNFQSISVI